MLINEVVNVSDQKLIALTQFLIGRAVDTDAQEPTSIDSFISMANDMGVSIKADQLRDLAVKTPLNNVIANVTDDEVIFKGSGASTQANDTMTVTQAQDTVEKMAQRAAKN
jgi:hypothetical protein